MTCGCGYPRAWLTTALHTMTMAGTGVLSALWQRVLDLFCGNEFCLLTFGSVAVTVVVFVLVNLPFALLDLTGYPQFLLKYKIQDEKEVPANWETYKKTLVLVAFNALVTTSLVQLLIYPLWAWRVAVKHPLPTFSRMLWDLFVCAADVEVMFYYSHRLFHHPVLYKYVHKIHHEWKAPVGVASIYCHPVEHVGANLLPVVSGPILAGCHLGVAWVWFAIVVVATTNNHSGYHFPFMLSSESHDYHHAKFNQCYGVFGVLDYLHSTDLQFRKSICYTRHKLLTSLSPAKFLYPDNTAGR